MLELVSMVSSQKQNVICMFTTVKINPSWQISRGARDLFMYVYVLPYIHVNKACHTIRRSVFMKLQLLDTSYENQQIIFFHKQWFYALYC